MRTGTALTVRFIRYNRIFRLNFNFLGVSENYPAAKITKQNRTKMKNMKLIFFFFIFIISYFENIKIRLKIASFLTILSILSIFFSSSDFTSLNFKKSYVENKISFHIDTYENVMSWKKNRSKKNRGIQWKKVLIVFLILI